eukprot:gene15042-17794_t
MAYVRLFNKALDILLPDPVATINPEDMAENSDSVLDMLAVQRMQKRRKEEAGLGARVKDDGTKQENAVPPDLVRRHELLILPRHDSYYTKRGVFSPVPIRNIRSEHIGHLVTMSGVVTRVTDVKPMITVASYACDQCDAEVYQEILRREFMPIFMCVSSKCTEGTPGSLTLQSRGSKFIKFQELKIQELADQVPIGHTPRTIKVFVRGELTRRASPGDIITLHGVFLPTPYSGHKAISVGLLADTYIEAMGITQHKKTYDQYDLSPEMAERVESEGLRDDIYERLAKSIAPEIFGHLDVKKALLLMMVGGTSKKMADGMQIRGDINICLMGDPGVAKSQLLKHISKLAPRGIYTSGKGSSGVGLTAAVIKDSVTGEFVLEGGSLVLADMGICCIDEFDKMEDSDRTAIHEVMEQQTISIAKAGITTTLNARTSILAAANPAFGRYNFKKTPDENFNLPPSLLSRFDLLFLIVDRADAEHDRMLSEHVTYVHQHAAPPKLSFDAYSADLLRSYVSQTRKYDPFVPRALTEYIVESYVTMRKQEGAAKEPFTYTTARTLLGILRLAQAHARCLFQTEVTQANIEEATRLMFMSKQSIRIDKQKKGAVDPSSVIYGIIRELCTKLNRRDLTYTDVLAKVISAGFNPQQLIETLDEYMSLNIVMVDAQKTTIRMIS